MTLKQLRALIANDAFNPDREVLIAVLAGPADEPVMYAHPFCLGQEGGSNKALELEALPCTVKLNPPNITTEGDARHDD